jgi:hypothetical protein
MSQISNFRLSENSDEKAENQSCGAFGSIKEFGVL